jgi:predicted AlkP superfamily pyrophosphatase or phosphodiesterase
VAARAPGTRGSHGYDNALPSMRAVFIARGPSFKQGQTIEGFDNVDVYPLLARLLGVPAAPNDGDPERLLPALR